MLLQNMSAFLLHNAQVLLENVMVITKFNKFIFRCKSLLSNATYIIKCIDTNFW